MKTYMSDAEEIVDNRILSDEHFDLSASEGLTPIDRALSQAINSMPVPAQPLSNENRDEGSFTQWALGGNGKFSPVGESTQKLQAGIYEPFATPASWGLERLKISSDEIYELPDMATNTVLEEAERFWTNESRYRKHNLLYKRGIILYGPPGSGKSVTLKLLMNKLVAKDGIVIIVHNVGLAGMCLKALKRIEPNRNLICIFEDIDEILASNGESTLLSMLDGEHNVDRVMNIATTNYPDRLGARIINRPSRFDRRVLVGMPGADARSAYLQKATGGSLAPDMLARWTIDTKGMSVAHLRELVAAVYCLDQSYQEVIDRLSNMAKKVEMADEFTSGKMGFGVSTRGRKNTEDW